MTGTKYSLSPYRSWLSQIQSRKCVCVWGGKSAGWDRGTMLNTGRNKGDGERETWFLQSPTGTFLLLRALGTHCYSDHFSHTHHVSHDPWWHPSRTPWGLWGKLQWKLKALNKWATGENDEVSSVLICTLSFFFPHSNLGSGRSQWGQGLAQCDTAENGSLLHPVLPRDSILLKMPWEFCYCWIWAEGKGALEMGRENSWQKKPRLTQVTRFTHLKTWTAPQTCSSLSISS